MKGEKLNSQDHILASRTAWKTEPKIRFTKSVLSREEQRSEMVTHKLGFMGGEENIVYKEPREGRER